MSSAYARPPYSASIKASKEQVVKNKILVVEDEQIVAHELQHTLQAQGYEISTAENGEEAIARTRTHAPNLALLDIVLPGAIDGIAAAEQLQNLNIPVVYITGYSDSQLFDRARHTTLLHI